MTWRPHGHEAYEATSRFWMGADGDTLLEKSNRLEPILGSDLTGARLSDHMNPSESARLHALIERFGRTADQLRL